MARYIDADSFLKHEIKRCDGEMPFIGTCSTTNFTLKSEIDKFPTVDAAPVVHGEWIYAGGFPCCNRCGASPAVCEPKPNNPSGFPMWCYGCGAKMDGVTDTNVGSKMEADDATD